MELNKEGLKEIKLKLLNNGRYTWVISYCFSSNNTDAVTELRQIDSILKDKFPDYATRGAGKVYSLDDE